MTWLTFDDVLQSMVEYGIAYKNLTQTLNATSDYFIDGGASRRIRFTHRALIKNIIPGTRYCKKIFYFTLNLN